MRKKTPNTTSLCEHCGKGFSYYLVPKHKDNPKKHQRFCSYDCSKHRKRVRKSRDKPCLECGKIMIVKPHVWIRKKFCSRVCKTKWHTGRRRETDRISVICPMCHCEFRTKRSHGNRRQCCSMDCANKYRSNNPDNVWTDVTCVQCGKSFSKRTYRIKQGQRIYCGYDCRRAWQRDNRHLFHVCLTCEICGSEFSRSRYFVEVRKDARFCSRKCLDRFNSLNKRGELNTNWRGGHIDDYGPTWSSQSRLARNRDKNICQLCSATDEHRNLDVHHITPFRVFEFARGLNNNDEIANRLENLITLCRKCHKKVEKKPELINLGQKTPTPT